ncbi:myosin light chain kinase, putative [Entamoeba invadens IP1]|uniref:non-specific serine/threonine protein kinase n=1 Tax=Entamoeba invadens IP1 TaxID=370355 RepID=A0A0A1U1D7_ENTIV|nr:myosin light chain kinase, putative [Entamoeba invadens IP1]ELP87840.1 myosin light chain kinase, putative [Entamoeba invadens IP1]|eukprot:XP_004254611.1 myosin light chain kinase, putative [Entamoeba invadens IP1]
MSFTAGTSITSPHGEVYLIHGLISRGGFSCVYTAHMHPDKSKLYAIKVIDKRKIHGKTIEHIEREISISQQVDNPYLLGMKEVIETQVQFLMIMEYVEGGELFEVLKTEGVLSLRQNIKILTQICSGVEYLHTHFICHRDIKPENILCSAAEEPFDVRLADFGLAVRFDEEVLNTSCGTLHYAAPEIVGMKESYNEMCDMWSIGVLAFVLLTVSFPFDGSVEEVKEKIMKGEIDWERFKGKDLCDEALDFVKKLLVVKAEKRLKAKECLEHPFLHLLDVEDDIDIPLDIIDDFDL